MSTPHQHRPETDYPLEPALGPDGLPVPRPVSLRAAVTRIAAVHRHNRRARRDELTQTAPV